MYFLYFHFYFFAEAWMKGKSAQWNSWTHIIPAQFICKLIPILAISNVKTTSTARDKHIIGLSLPHPSFLSPLSYVFLFAFFFHRRSFLSRWCEFLADSYNNNELYLHDHNYTNTCTNTYSIAKAMFRNQNYNTGQLRYFDNNLLRTPKQAGIYVFSRG